MLARRRRRQGEAVEGVGSARERPLLLEEPEQGSADAQRFVRGVVADLAFPAAALGRDHQRVAQLADALGGDRGQRDVAAPGLERPALAAILARGRRLDGDPWPLDRWKARVAPGADRLAQRDRPLDAAELGRAERRGSVDLLVERSRGRGDVLGHLGAGAFAQALRLPALFAERGARLPIPIGEPALVGLADQALDPETSHCFPPLLHRAACIRSRAERAR
jgi:hypothetical protein